MSRSTWTSLSQSHRGEPGLGLAAEHGVHRLLPELAERVPEGEVEGGERLDGQPLPPVVDGRAPALVPDQLHVARVLGGGCSVVSRDLKMANSFMIY